ncbi:hypothetical protein BJX68DRAFT_261883 [Aspergillus pseudodeflectus]|uniref:Uncharacterized protein n=1 Tax=Aspergillus pseudodeflectus TaxID=176178 RepID=A0ABR4L4G0_9EURO
MADQNRVLQRWRAIQEHSPTPGEEHFGIYIPDNAPEGTFYFGVGKIIETGATPSVETYIWFEPYGRCNRSIVDGSCDCHEGKNTAYYRFFDPGSGEDMPAKYLPPYRLNRDELDRGGLGRASRLPEPKSLPIRGSEATGGYIAPTTQMYDGVGRVLQGHARGGEFFAWVEPIPGKTDGVYRFSENNNGSTMHYMDMPSYNVDDGWLSAMMQDLLAQPRPKKDGNLPSWRYSTPAARHDTFPKPGSEAMGTYIAPDERFYVALGKVTAVGLNNCGAIYALVTPIPGKSGGDYDFYDQLTFEYMPDFTGHTISKSRFPWRDYFSKTVDELAPKLKGSNSV